MSDNTTSAGGFAFPRTLPDVLVSADVALRIVESHGGMTLRDYAAIKFAAAWTAALGSRNMAENYYERGDEAVRLGLAQADAFLKARQS